jgi:hypothetical protein
MTERRSLWRRPERFALGLVFGFAAWIIERRVLKAIRRRGEQPPARSSLAEETTSELGKPTAR